ncbi:unnamed protein product, partial [Mesorhabditis belari]|uniref:Zinc transporter 6 n=1 Tax=Mesorhabditis belari TaxID=2138241 RepID=A0AAF3J1P8_9BILA
MLLNWVAAVLQHSQGLRGLISAGVCSACVITSFICTSSAHSLVLMSSSWIAVFALCSILSSLYSMTITHKALNKFSYGLARVPVLAVFSTTVLAQLFSIFLMKESFEHLLAPDHHGSGGHDHDGGHSDHSSSEVSSSWPFLIGALSTSIALIVSAYSLRQQPFQHVLTAAASSSLQEHAADLSHAICWMVPGLSRLLLPRINAMVLLAISTSSLLVFCEQFRQDFAWADPVSCIILSIAVFSTMYPLSTYTGRILLQTAPPHLLNQLDRCLNEASTIDGVLELRVAHFWQLDFSQMVGTVEVRVRRDADEQNVLALVTDKLGSLVNVLAVQIVKDSAWVSTDDALAGSTFSFTSQKLNRNENVGNFDNHNGHGHSHESGNHGHSHGPATSYGAPSLNQPPQYAYQQAFPPQSSNQPSSTVPGGPSQYVGQYAQSHPISGSMASASHQRVFPSKRE